MQQALGVVQTLKSPGRAEFQLFMNLERQVQENLAASRDSTSVVNQVKKLKYQKIKINYSLYILHFFFCILSSLLLFLLPRHYFFSRCVLFSRENVTNL